MTTNSRWTRNIRSRGAAWLRRIGMLQMSAGTTRTIAAARNGTAERHVRRYLGIAPLLLGAVLLGACSEGSSPSEPQPQPVPVAAVVVNPTTIALNVGQTQTVAASPRDAQDGVLQRPVAWQTSNAAVATVSNAGVVSAIGVGEAIIKAVAEGKEGTAAVQVAAAQSELALSADTLLFTGIAGIATPAPKSVQVTAKSGIVEGIITQLSYYEGEETGWLSTALSGAKAPATLTVTAATGILLPRTYRGRVRVEADERFNAPARIVEVIFVVLPGPQLNVSASDRHNCAVDLNGLVYCWGYNGSRQLGVGSMNALESKPVQLPGDQRFLAVSTGELHACGITIDRAAMCWGTGYMGDGNGAGTGLAPRAVTSSQQWAQLAAGYRHTCGITMQGEAYCWGANGSGQLGNNTTTDQRTPVKVQTNLTFADITAGAEHSCGRTANDEAYCWGSTGEGRLGIGSPATTAERAPVKVSGNHAWASIEAGQLHTCGVTRTGQALCWGYNSDGQLGDESRTHRNVPTAVTGGLQFRAIAAGHHHTCAIAFSNAAYCWGYRQHGGVGDGIPTGYALAPARVVTNATFVRLTTGNNHSCGVSPADQVFCWGYNENRAVGDGGRTDQHAPVRIFLK